MNQEPSTLYAKLLGETASISWKELEPFFAKGALLWVDPGLDLIAAAEAVAQDEGRKWLPGWLLTSSPSCLKRGRWIFLSVIHSCGPWLFRRGFWSRKGRRLKGLHLFGAFLSEGKVCSRVA